MAQQLRMESSNFPLSALPFPNQYLAGAEVLAFPSMEGGEYSYDPTRAREGEERRPRFKLSYNKEKLEFMTALSNSIERLVQDAAGWSEYLAELEEWESTVADGLVDKDFVESS